MDFIFKIIRWFNKGRSEKIKKMADFDAMVLGTGYYMETRFGTKYIDPKSITIIHTAREDK